jgi:hypothetical protein
VLKAEGNAVAAQLREAEARADAVARENGALKAELDRLAHQARPARHPARVPCLPRRGGACPDAKRRARLPGGTRPCVGAKAPARCASAEATHARTYPHASARSIMT